MKRTPLGKIVERVGTCRPGIVMIGTAEFPYRLTSVRDELEKARGVWLDKGDEVDALRLATAAMRRDLVNRIRLLAA